MRWRFSSMYESVELRTERLFLRPFRVEDVDDTLAVTSGPQLGDYLQTPQPVTRRYVEEWVARQILHSWETEPGWAVVLDGKVVGQISLQVNVANQVAEMVYAIAQEHWGKGLMPEAAGAVIKWGFAVRGFAKIMAKADIRNERSWRVMEKLGMTREAVLRGHRIARDERVDDAYYGLLREEWEAARSGRG